MHPKWGCTFVAFFILMNLSFVFYMAVEKITLLAENLKKYFAGNLPVAVVYHVGFPEKERILQGTLGTISMLTAGEEERWMGLVIVGRCLEGSVLQLPVQL